ncbi:MAG: VOC family protein [Brumimicrobium sp.]|nr:VOC family protein [Brumimicrobium sp.]
MQTKANYRIPGQTRIGHVHLKVSDLEKSLDFYRDLLGFEVKQRYGNDAAFLAAGSYHHHIGLNVWFSKNGSAAPKNSTGLFHLAIVYPSRKDLAEIFQRLRDADYPITGASDHGVSEAIYLSDPDNNGLELYWDKPVGEWPRSEDDSLNMYTRPLDLQNLLKEIR